MFSKEHWIEKILEGHVPTAARFITLLENRDQKARAILAELFLHSGRAWVVGVTGSPGAGKSVLSCRIAQRLHKRGLKVGVIAVDPSSAFSGGAILGDRVRWEKSGLDSDVFIRSMATRGRLGGLSASTRDAVTVMDAMGRDVVLIETVGVGQNEIDVLEIAHTTLLVLTPGQGDEVQAVKSGVMEIGDLFVINKADQPGADKSAREIRHALSLSGRQRDWMPEVFLTVATTGQGVDELMEGLFAHREYLCQNSLLGANKFNERLLVSIATDLMKEAVGGPAIQKLLADLVCTVREKKSEPYSAARCLMDACIKTDEKGR